MKSVLLKLSVALPTILLSTSPALPSILYLSTGSDRHIYAFNSAGVRSTIASFVGLSPQGLAVDPQGNLFVGVTGPNFGSGYIAKISPSGVQSTFATGLSDPLGLAFDAAGNLYVGDFNPLQNGASTNSAPMGFAQRFRPIYRTRLIWRGIWLSMPKGTCSFPQVTVSRF
jgi:DNA-binding beta-propeller fold protein YncE